MAARLWANGDIRDPLWRDAFADTARHLLLPVMDPAGIDGGPVGPQCLGAVYCDDILNAASGEDPRSAAAPSQLTPATLAWLLALLIPAGTPRSVRVLEVGAGYGYATALLCHRLGAEQVTATDPLSADRLRGVLAGMDLFPCLVSAQDVRGASPYGPFGAILCSRAQTVSRAWFDQLAEGGRIVTPVRGPDGRVAATVYHRSDGRVSSQTVTPNRSEASTCDIVTAVTGRGEAAR